MSVGPDPMFAPHGALPKAEESGTSDVERLMIQFEAHEHEELEFIGEYKSIIEENPNPLVQFLLQLVISDEEKHHALVHAMAASLRADLSWRSSDDAIATLDHIAPESKSRLLELTTRFIDAENAGIKEYEDLIKQSKGYYGGVFVLLLKTIIHDSEKHVMILKFLKDTLRRA